MADTTTSLAPTPTTDECLAAVEKRLAAIERRTNDAARAASEAVWAQVFHDTIRGSIWLKNQTFDFISSYQLLIYAGMPGRTAEWCCYQGCQS